MTRRTIAASLGLPMLAVLTLAVAACGGDDGGSTPDVTIPAGALVVNAGPGLKFDQTEYTIASTNGKVVIAYVQVDSTQRHTMLVKDSANIVIGEKLDVTKIGATDVATFALTPGTYQLYCDVPGHEGMKATLTVT